MFKPGDWVWGIDEQSERKIVANLLVVGDVGKYYLCFDSITVDELNFEENMDLVYKWYKDDSLIAVNVIKKEYTFATEQEAKEVLESEV